MHPDDGAVSLSDILTLQHKELTRFHAAFAALLAGGYDFVEPMQNVFAGLERAWELLSYAFEAAISSSCSIPSTRPHEAAPESIRLFPNIFSPRESTKQSK